TARAEPVQRVAVSGPDALRGGPVQLLVTLEMAERAASDRGSLENRARIISEIFDRARRSAGPRFIVGAKFNATDGVPGGLSPEEGVELARLLEQRGADYLAVSRGDGESADDIIRRRRLPAGRPAGMDACRPTGGGLFRVPLEAGVHGNRTAVVPED